MFYLYKLQIHPTTLDIKKITHRSEGSPDAWCYTSYHIALLSFKRFGRSRYKLQSGCLAAVAELQVQGGLRSLHIGWSGYKIFIPFHSFPWNSDSSLQKMHSIKIRWACTIDEGDYCGNGCHKNVHVGRAISKDNRCSKKVNKRNITYNYLCKETYTYP